MGDVGVSLAEIIEVRGCGLNDDELLALIIIGCEVLTKTPAGVYAPEHVILHTDGELEVYIWLVLFTVPVISNENYSETCFIAKIILEL